VLPQVGFPIEFCESNFEIESLKQKAVKNGRAEKEGRGRDWKEEEDGATEAASAVGAFSASSEG